MGHHFPILFKRLTRFGWRRHPVSGSVVTTQWDTLVGQVIGAHPRALLVNEPDVS